MWRCQRISALVNSGMAPIESSLRLAIIGVGGWGKNHARVLHDLGVLVAICDVNENLAKEIADKYNVRSYYSIDEMLDNERKLDACLVCTPTKTHFSVAKKIMEMGINVFVEKPLSFSSKECEEMMAVSEKKKLILTSGYIERFNPAVHDIDTAMFLFNSRPHVIFARAGKKFHLYEDFATIMLGFEDQKVAIIASNWITPNKVRRFTAVCTDALITGDFITQEIKVDHGEATIIPRRQQYHEPLALELKSFLDAIDGKISKPVISALDATNVTKVAEAALLSNDTGSPIYLDLN